MLQIMNPGHIQLPHAGAANNANIGIVVNYWENARPLIKELEQTVSFAERKYGDLMQQLNLCKEYYEKWSTEKFGPQMQHQGSGARKARKRLGRKHLEAHSSSENESEKAKPDYIFNEKLRNKIYEITNEIKDANRKIALKETCFTGGQKPAVDAKNVPALEGSTETMDVPQGEPHFIPKHITRSEPTMTSVLNENVTAKEQKVVSHIAKACPAKLPQKRRCPVVVKTMQKYKLRSKSLPQGVRRKFGFGSFVEVVDKQRPGFSAALARIKSRTTVSSGSRSNHGKDSGDGRKSRAKERTFDRVEVSTANAACSGDSCNYSNTKYSSLASASQMTLHRSECDPSRSGSNVCNDSSVGQVKHGLTAESVTSNSRFVKVDLSTMKQKALIVAPRQPIPFTICRTSKTFNLGLNIQQVLAMIKSKRHSTLLQTIIKDNIRTARSVIHKTEPTISTLFIASSRIAANDSDVCPARDYGDRCYSVVSSNDGPGSGCNMLACSQTVRTHVLRDQLEGNNPPVKYNDLQRPEDVWVVEQPDPRQNFPRFPSRCTCYPTKHSVDYNKVLNQYSRMKRYHQKAEEFAADSLSSSNFNARLLMCGPELRPLPAPSQITCQGKVIGSNLQMKKVQDDLDDLSRRYERIQEQVTERNMDEYEVDAELDALEVELNDRERDCKCIMDFCNQLMELRKKIRQLRGRVKSATNLSESTRRGARSRKDPFRPTPSMTLTRVLRQIQCLQDKIKLIDSPSVT